MEFANRTWDARLSRTPTGAGPSLWSTKGLALTPGGDLELRLSYGAEGLFGVELSTPLPDRYCNYCVDIASPLHDLDPNVVFAVFVYRNDSSEFDVEFTRWGDQAAQNAQFVVAPATEQSLKRFQLSPHTRAKVCMNWQRRQIRFTLQTDHPQEETWVFKGSSVPTPDSHRLHINLWHLPSASPLAELPKVRISRVHQECRK